MEFYFYTVSVSLIKTSAQLEAGLSFFAATASDDFKLDAFEEACEVGMIKKIASFRQVINVRMFYALFVVFRYTRFHAFEEACGVDMMKKKKKSIFLTCY